MLYLIWIVDIILILFASFILLKLVTRQSPTEEELLEQIRNDPSEELQLLSWYTREHMK